MAYLTWPPLAPGDSKDFSIDWRDWLSPGDSIAASTWSVPAGLSISVSAFSNTVTSVWLTGGGVSAGSIMDVQNRITTAQGRICSKTVALPINYN